MKECPGCAEVELIEYIKASERACWLCCRIDKKWTTLKRDPLIDGMYDYYNYIPPGWVHSDLTMEYIGPKGQRVSMNELQNRERDQGPMF